MAFLSVPAVLVVVCPGRLAKLMLAKLHDSSSHPASRIGLPLQLLAKRLRYDAATRVHSEATGEEYGQNSRHDSRKACVVCEHEGIEGFSEANNTASDIN